MDCLREWPMTRGAPGRLIALACAFCLIAFPHEARADSHDAPSQFRISHFHHPAMPEFKALIARTYAQIGIEVAFQPAPTARGLILLNNGLTDADVVRMKHNVTEYQDIVVVSPSLVTAEIVLLCPLDVHCSKDILNHRQNLVSSNIGNQNMLESLNIQATILFDETNRHFIDMLRTGHANYAIYGTNAAHRETLQQEFTVIVLSQQAMHHVINRKHLHLLDKIETALADV